MILKPGMTVTYQCDRRTEEAEVVQVDEKRVKVRVQSKFGGLVTKRIKRQKIVKVKPRAGARKRGER
jgi:hypothetical protein